MKTRFLSGLLGLGVLLLAATGCRKQDDPVYLVTNQNTPTGQDTTAGLQFRFSSVVNGQPLVLDSAWYTNSLGDSFRVGNHRYYVSNFKLHTTTGATVALPETYLLADARVPETRVIKNIPVGTYDSVTFLLGVDAPHNTSGAQEGDLSPAKGMFWTWKTGYIMAKLEGFSPQSTFPGSAFFYHIGGYEGFNNALRTVTVPLPAQLKLTAGKSPTLQFQADIASWFSGTTPISIHNLSTMMEVSAESSTLADNYSKGFSVVRIDP